MSKNYLVPVGHVQVTTAQRDAIASPQAGFVVFNTDTGVKNTYDGTNWSATATGGVSTLLGLTDTPSTFGAPGEIPVINAAGDGLEFNSLAVPQPIPPVLTERVLDLGGVVVETRADSNPLLTNNNRDISLPNDTVNGSGSNIMYPVNGNQDTLEVSMDILVSQNVNFDSIFFRFIYVPDEIANITMYPSTNYEASVAHAPYNISWNGPRIRVNKATYTHTHVANVNLVTTNSTLVVDNAQTGDLLTRTTINIKCIKTSTNKLKYEVYHNGQLWFHDTTGINFPASGGTFIINYGSGDNNGTTTAIADIYDLMSVTQPIPDIGKHLALNLSGTGYELVDPNNTFLGLGDTPTTYGTPGQIYVINATGDGLDWVEPKVDQITTTLPVYADNTAALAGSLVAGDVYRTSTGIVMVVF